MYKVLYRTYRPEVFSQVLGQQHIVRVLENQIGSGDVNHAYLFCGTRGTGKTTMARLLAKGVNCLDEDTNGRPCGKCENCRSIAQGSFMDLIEIDAASNNGVENIRELRENVNYPPVVGRMKVYVIDEVHMLSNAAFNALLKTLEEPPESVMFVLCTTEPEKLPATVLSRCMRMDFRRVAEEELAGRVRQICIDRGITMEESAVRVIVSVADGSARDCLTILDQCIAGRTGTVSRDQVLEAIGAVGEEVYTELTEMVNDNDPAGGLLVIDRLIKDGRDSRQILRGWMNHYRNLLMAKVMRNPEDVLSMSVENIERIEGQARRTEMESINNAVMEIARTISEAKGTNQPRILLEICMVKLATTTSDGRVVKVNMEKARRKEAEKVKTDDYTINDDGSITYNGPEEEPAYDAGYDEDDNDIDEIWAEIIEDGESQSHTFTIVRTGAVPIKMNDSEFVIKVTNQTGKYLEKNRAPMEQLIEKYTGGYHKMILRKEEEEEEQSSLEITADKASEMLGIKVEIN